MARLPRLRLPEYPLHVVVRGNNRQRIFATEGDRIFFHRTLAEAARRFGALVHAYVLMPNHVHLLASSRLSDSISKTMQSLGRRYVAYFNFVHKRTGTLWEGRFHSSLVDCDRYFLACQRYIELNPVRAGICAHPSEFAWSSYGHYARGLGDDLITRHSVHAQFASASEYCRIFDEELGPSSIEAIRDAVQHGWALGDERFRRHVTELAGRRGERITLAGRPAKLN